MTRIDTNPINSAVSPVAAAQEVVPLTQRLRQQAADSLPTEEPVSSPESEQEEEEEPIRVWAKQIFIEKVFFGEEEENGIPPLSI